MSVIRTEQTVTASVVSEILCDRCGASCIAQMGTPEHPMALPEYARLLANWGYGSRYDGEQWECELCESCAEEVRHFINAGQGSGVRVEDHSGLAHLTGRQAP